MAFCGGNPCEARAQAFMPRGQAVAAKPEYAALARISLNFIVRCFGQCQKPFKEPRRFILRLDPYNLSEWPVSKLPGVHFNLSEYGTRTERDTPLQRSGISIDQSE